MNPSRNDRNRQALGDGHNMVAVAMTFGIVVMLCVLAGFWLDRRFGLTPLLTLAGMVVGSVWAGFWGWQRLGLGRKPPRDDE